MGRGMTMTMEGQGVDGGVNLAWHGPDVLGGSLRLSVTNAGAVKLSFRAFAAGHTCKAHPPSRVCCVTQPFSINHCPPDGRSFL